MEEPKDRLAGVVDAKKDELKLRSRSAVWAHYQRQFEAAEIGKDLFISNCNGNREISRRAAALYAKIFGRSAGWYLFGDETPKSTEFSAAVAMASKLTERERLELFEQLSRDLQPSSEVPAVLPGVGRESSVPIAKTRRHKNS